MSRTLLKSKFPNLIIVFTLGGSNKLKLFIDNLDYKYFLRLIERYLSQKPETSKAGAVYLHYAGEVELVAP